MIQIKKSIDKKFYVVVTGENNEVLSTSETLNSKQAAWKNIHAQCKMFQKPDTLNMDLVQDDTLKSEN